VLNIGSGRPVTIREVAERIASAIGKPDIRAEIPARYRIGDVRHCFADISAARQVLGYEPKIDFDRGLHELADWLSDQVAIDRADAANAELTARGLAV
jgi:dTDP-L-rhamnose 4-epimerase